MDNPKIIRIDNGTELSNGKVPFIIAKTQNFIVVSETETHFFIKIKDKGIFSVWKHKVNYVTYKDRTLKFDELKKPEILNIFSNYEKLVKQAQHISKYISQLRVDQHDMSILLISELNIKITETHIILERRYIDKIYSCEVPLKYLWDHSWRQNVIKDYGSIQ